MWIGSSLPVCWEKEALLSPVDCYSVDTIRPSTDTFTAFVAAHFDNSFDFAIKNSDEKYLDGFDKLLNSVLFL